MTGTGKQSVALSANFLRHDLHEAAPRAARVEGYMEHDAAVYRTLLESTEAILWKIDWATMEFAYVGSQIEASRAAATARACYVRCGLLEASVCRRRLPAPTRAHTTIHPGPML